MEPDVLPVFYFNDLLLANIGDTIGRLVHRGFVSTKSMRAHVGLLRTEGLNLFEPRYQLMCNRMASDPRFLFMPNYEDFVKWGSRYSALSREVQRTTIRL